MSITTLPSVVPTARELNLPVKSAGWKVWALHDGWMEVPVNSFIAPRTASSEEVQDALAEIDQAGDTLRLPVLALLIQTADDLVLVDAGCGRDRTAYPLAGHLVKSLRSAGFQPQQVTKLILTHAHLDHTGGLVDGEGRALFPHATVFLHEAEAAHWQELIAQEHVAADQQVTIDALSEIWQAIEGNLVICRSWDEALPGMQLVPLPGHTPGHCAVQLKVNGKPVLFHLSDLTLHQHIYLANPHWDFLLDLDHEEAIETRYETLHQLAETGMPVFGTHFPYPGLGRVKQKDDAFAWAPLEA